MKVIELTEVGQSATVWVPVEKFTRFTAFRDQTSKKMMTAVYLRDSSLPFFCQETPQQIKAMIEAPFSRGTMNSPAWRLTAARRGQLRDLQYLIHDLAANGMGNAKDVSAIVNWLAERADQERGEAFANGILRYDTTQNPATEQWSD